MVEAWEQKLGVLNQMVGSVEPRPEVWDRIRTAVGLSEPQAPLVLPEASLPPPVAPEVDAACRDGGHLQRHPVVRHGPALAQRRHADDGDRGGTGRHDRGSGLSAGSACPIGFVPSRGRRWLRSKTARRSGAAVRPVCRGPAEGGRLAGLHSHGRRGDQEFHGSQGRRRRRTRQELRAVADLGQAAAAALARRDRRRRLHRASGAGVLRHRYHQGGDLCGDGRAGRRIARRQADFSAGVCRQADRDRVPPARRQS